MSVCLSVSPSLCISVSLSGCPHHFLVIICTARNCAQRMWPNATGSNTLGGSIICPSVRPSCCPRAFCNFCICINFLRGGPASWCIYIIPTLCSEGPQWGTVEIIPTLGYEVPQWSLVGIIYPSIRLSLCISVRLSASIFGNHSRDP